MCGGTGALSSPGTPPPAPNATAITQSDRRLLIIRSAATKNTDSQLFPRSDIRRFIEKVFSGYFGRQKLCFYLLQILHFGVTCDRNWVRTSDFPNSDSAINSGPPSNPYVPLVVNLHTLCNSPPRRNRGPSDRWFQYTAPL